MTPVYIDFETFWSTDHSLSKMTNIEYVMHPATEIISLAIKVGNFNTDVFFGEPVIKKALQSLNWSDKMAIGHNMSGFDSLILSWRFGINPALWGCTLAMARSKYNANVGGSLAKLVAHFGIGVKDNSALMNTKGRYLKDFTEEEIKAMREYNKADTEQCAALFKILAKELPRKELLQIDLTTRMLTEPQFELDSALLKETLTKVQEEKLKSLQMLTDLLSTPDEQVLHRFETGQQMAEFTRTQLMSAIKFSELLEKRGVAVPMKVSPSNKEKMIPALSKTDEDFLALQEHDDPIVAAAAQARLEAKSTLLETRIKTMLAVGSRTKGMRISVPLKYAGATTTGRWSGETWNPQNLPRIDPSRPKLSDALRKSLRAPKGYSVVTSDLSGIELRVNMFLWKVQYAMDLFEADPAKADLYKTLASKVLEVEYTELTKNQRAAGKAMHLGCIAEGSLVLTDVGLVKIEEVSTSHKVWDGIEWVSHEGPIYKGEQEVFTYDSLTATPDHIVYLRDGTSCRFDRAAAEALGIAITGHGRDAVRISEDHIGHASTKCIELGNDSVPMHPVRDEKVDRTTQPEAWDDKRLPKVQSAEKDSEMAGPSDNSYETEVYESERPGVQELRRSRNTVSVRVGTSCGPMDTGVNRATEATGIGSDRQRWPLREREFAVGHRADADNKSESNDASSKGLLRGESHASGGSIRQWDAPQASEAHDIRPDCGQVVQSKIVQTKRHVWDLLNAGPRHRFTVDGHLVSNCGFGLGSTKKYVGVAKSMAQIIVSEEDAAVHIAGYRAEHPEIVAGWKTCQSVLPYIRSGTEMAIDPWGLCKTAENSIILPSGRRIWYQGLHQERNSEGKTEWWYGEGRNRARIYGPKIVENICQALARDVIAEVVQTMWVKHRVKPALLCHDEIVCVVPDGKASEVQEKLDAAMRAPTSWWPQLIKWSESDVGLNYGETK